MVENIMFNEMYKGVSTRTTGKDIDPSLRYWGPSSPELVTHNHYDAASQPIFKSPSFGFSHMSNDPTIKDFNKLMDFSTTLTDTGKYLVFASASRKDAYLKEDIAKYGLVHNPDESMKMMDGWIGSTVGSHAINAVNSNKEVELFELPEHKINYSQFGMTDVNLYVKDFSGTVPINKAGFYFSKIGNAKEHLRDLIFNDDSKVPGYNSETIALLERLDAGREITAIGVENMKNAAAGIYRRNGTSTLVESTHIYEQAQAIAQKHGLNGSGAIDEIIQYFLKHELVHNSDHRVLTSTKKQEIYVGKILEKFYSDRASIVTEKLARYYRALAKENRDYAISWESRIKHLAGKYALEAKEMGLDEEDARDYIENKLDHEIEDLEKSELEATIENEENNETGKDEIDAAEKDKEYSKREISTDDDTEESETEQEAEPETTNESAE